MLYVFYITTIPYLPCNKTRKELYDFYYTLVTLTTWYKPYINLQGVGKEDVPWRISTVNQEFKLCETYPQLLGVPLATSDEDLKAVASFRSKGRIPVSHS